MLDFLEHFKDHCNKHLFMDFEGDEGNVIILSFSAFSDFDEKDTIYVCACDRRSEAWATSINCFIAIIEDPKIKKYYMDDPGHSDIRSRLAHIFHHARPNLSVQHLGLELMRDRERFHIFGFTRFFRYPCSHHPGLPTLLHVCHSTHIAQFGNPINGPLGPPHPSPNFHSIIQFR